LLRIDERFNMSVQRLQKLLALLFFLLLAALPAMSQAAKSKGNPSSYEGDFFIISSVNLQKKQLLLKMPTEVTEVMHVDEKTTYLDESGKPIHLSGLRAGDTVYIVSKATAEGPLALRIRKGPMTIQLLHQRYLPGLP
jgi:hypothetical protein